MNNMTLGSILILDSNKSVARTFSRLLAKEGYTVDQAEDGKDALQKLCAKKYDLVIADVELLNDESSCLLLDSLKSSPKSVKIVFSDFPKLAEDLESDSSQTQLEKPIDPERLLKIVRKSLGKE